MIFSLGAPGRGGRKWRLWWVGCGGLQVKKRHKGGKSKRARGTAAIARPQASLARTSAKPRSQNRLATSPAASTVRTVTAQRDERFSLALLLAPFMIVAASLAGQQALRTVMAGHDAIVSARLDPTTPPLAPATPPALAPDPSTEVRPSPQALPAPRGNADAITSRPVKRAPLPQLTLLVKPDAPRPQASTAAPVPPPHVADAPQQCLVKADLMTRARDQSSRILSEPYSPHQFGRALAAAARAQLDDFVLYNARYSRIAFPNGDVPALYGVCTDVIVRAMRAVGVDLQLLVRQSRTGTGDANIDHRRVEVLKKLFDKAGHALPVTDFGEDYLPGDVVTYYRPQNRTTTGHIAIVSDVIAPSGRPMIIHNRGWGPQLEDALFVDKITGHYRFDAPEKVASAAVPPKPATPFATTLVTHVLVQGKTAAVSRVPFGTTAAR